MINKRQSNFELMRIVSMMMIIVGHTFSWGGITRVASPHIEKLIYAVYAIILVHVNSFVLLSGYFQSDSKFKIKKALKLLIIMYFYKALIVLIGINFGWFSLTKNEILWQLCPINFSNYWFLNLYIVLYFLSPFLNKFINCLTKNNMSKLLVVLFVFCSVLTTITNQEIFFNSNGYSLVQFIFLYFVGAYIRKFVIDNEKKSLLYNEKKKLIVYFYISISLFILCFILNYFLYRFGIIMMNKDGLIYTFGNILKSSFMHYDNPLIIIGSISYFMFFVLLKFRSRAINILASSVMSVYIIHETGVFRSTLYSWFSLNKLKYVFSYKIFIRVLFIAVAIFIGATVVDFVRKILSKSLYIFIDKFNLFKNTRLKLKKIENKINLWMNI